MTDEKAEARAKAREVILAAQDLLREEVNVPEWGLRVHVRVMNGRERYRFEMLVNKKDAAPDRMRGVLAALCVCDADGVALFTADDIDALAIKSSPALDRVVAVALRLNGLIAEQTEKN